MKTKMNLPNIITLSRIIISPVFIYLYSIENLYWRMLVFCLILLCELTDFLDGYLARKFNQITDLGKILDPFADSIFRLTIFLCLLRADLINVWFFVICLYRDCLVQTVRIIAANNNIVFASKVSGKIKAWFQGLGIIIITFLTIINYVNKIPNLYLITNYIMLAVTIITAWSGIDYLFKLLKLLKSRNQL